MANNKKWGTKFLTIISALSLVGAGALVAISPASALDATSYLVTFEDDDLQGTEADQANSGEHPQGSWSGLTATLVDGISGKMLQMAKDGDPWSGVMITHFTDRKIGAEITFDFYSPETVTATSWVKLETDGASAATEMGFEATPGWARYTLDMTTASGWSNDAEYVNFIIFPNYNGGGDGTDVDPSGQLYAIDNISLNGAEMPAAHFPYLVTFEEDDLVGTEADQANSGEHPQGSWSGLVATLEDGPWGTQLQLAKNGDPWSGVMITHFDDRSIGSEITFDFYSPETVTATSWVKLETDGASSATEMGFEATPGWGRYTLDMTTSSAWSDEAAYIAFIIFPDYNGGGDGTDVTPAGQLYAIDNISINGAEMPEMVDFTVAPVKTKNPTITGTAKVGKKLTANGFIASWEGEPTLAYKWYSCTAKGKDNPSVKPAKCSAIAGASAQKLTLKKAQKGKFIRVRVTATNSAGSVSVFSDSTKVKVS